MNARLFKVIATTFFLSISLFANYSGSSINSRVSYADNIEHLCYDEYKIRIWRLESEYKSRIISSKLWKRLSVVKRQFLLDNLLLWIDISIQYNTPINISIAQACIESAYGTSYLYRRYNAMYGIKSYKRSDLKSKPLYDNLEQRSAQYRAYQHKRNSVIDHARLVSTKYDMSNWQNSLKRYATDTTYTNKLAYIIKNLNL